MNDKVFTEWHLDKRVPVGIIAALTLQAIVGFTYLGGLEQRVANIEATRFTRAEGTKLEFGVQYNKENIEKLEARTLRALDDIKATLAEISQKLEEDRRERRESK
jgi:hypothetical protein